MKNILLLTLLLWSSLAFPVCSNISRSNLGFGVTLPSATYNLDLNTVFSRANNMPGDCITDETITSAKILNGTIANADISITAAIAHSKLAASHVLSTSGSSTFTTTSTSYVDATNLTASITTTGRPVLITLVNADSTNPSYLQVVRGTTGVATGFVKCLRDATDVGFNQVENGDSVSVQTAFAPGAISIIDSPAAGTYTYKLQVKTTASSTFNIFYAKLLVREL